MHTDKIENQMTIKSHVADAVWAISLVVSDGYYSIVMQVVVHTETKFIMTSLCIADMHWFLLKFINTSSLYISSNVV